MKTLIMHRKITLSIFVMIMLLCGLGGVSYAQVCKVGMCCSLFKVVAIPPLDIFLFWQTDPRVSAVRPSTLQTYTGMPSLQRISETLGK